MRTQIPGAARTAGEGNLLWEGFHHDMVQFVLPGTTPGENQQNVISKVDFGLQLIQSISFKMFLRVFERSQLNRCVPAAEFDFLGAYIYFGNRWANRSWSGGLLKTKQERSH